MCSLDFQGRRCHPIIDYFIWGPDVASALMIGECILLVMFEPNIQSLSSPETLPRANHIGATLQDYPRMGTS